jgi:hypothetical protein
MKPGDIITVDERRVDFFRKQVYKSFLENRYQPFLCKNIHISFSTMTFIYLSPPKQTFFAEFDFFPSNDQK